MKLNWGAGIVFTFTLFAGSMIYLVWLCIKQPQDLVSIDYYNRELAFQQQINSESNTGDLSQPVMINYNASLQAVSIVFPPEMKAKSITGTLHFFKPDNAALDFEVIVQPDEVLTQQIATSKMKTGLWHVKADWKTEENSYYQEASVVIN